MELGLVPGTSRHRECGGILEKGVLALEFRSRGKGLSICKNVNNKR